MPSEAELLPCPFCGSVPVTTVSCAQETVGLISIGCPADAAQCPVSPHVFASTRSGAIKAWNTRAALSAASAVRSEPVAWEVELLYDKSRNHWSGKMLTDVLPADASTYRVIRALYTSPVQTREDGIREAAKKALAHLVYLNKTEQNKNLQQTIGELQRALSQPEPKGDKT